MISQIINKLTFLLDYDLTTTTLILSFLIGSVFAIPHALHPSSPNIAPLSPLNTAAISMFGSLVRTLILSSIILIIYTLLNNNKLFQKLKTQINKYFYNKFNRTAYGLYNYKNSFFIVLLLSCIPYISPILSSLTGCIVGIKCGRNLYLNIIGSIICDILITFYSLSTITKYTSLIIIGFFVTIAITLIIIPISRLEKR